MHISIKEEALTASDGHLVLEIPKLAKRSVRKFCKLVPWKTIGTCHIKMKKKIINEQKSITASCLKY